jgi:hypothetical protein
MLQFMLERDGKQHLAPQLPADVFAWCKGEQTGPAPARVTEPTIKLLQTLSRRAAAETEASHPDFARAGTLADVAARLV